VEQLVSQLHEFPKVFPKVRILTDGFPIIELNSFFQFLQYTYVPILLCPVINLPLRHLCPASFSMFIDKLVDASLNRVETMNNGGS